MATSFKVEQVSLGNRLIVEGEDQAKFFIIALGQVEVLSKGVHGSNLRMALLTEGEYFGEAEVVSDKHLLEEQILVPVTHPVSGAVPLIKAAGLPMHFSASESGFDRPAPAVGCHNEEIYGQMLGLTAETMAALKAEKVI